ncbi:serine protease-like protein 51 isoform X3 [Pan troglodytes]|uniref:serine protease-like protein 51 isoform X3 n=1 Tax=Pan troglodytes TaxID=9598 RepID=UPI0023F4C535|nr:serine protease-like protein 51 isoform X2 [Pan troglodytes]
MPRTIQKMYNVATGLLFQTRHGYHFMNGFKSRMIRHGRGKCHCGHGNENIQQHPLGEKASAEGHYSQRLQTAPARQ